MWKKDRKKKRKKKTGDQLHGLYISPSLKGACKRHLGTRHTEVSGAGLPLGEPTRTRRFAWKRKDTVAVDRFTLMTAAYDFQHLPLKSCPVEMDIAIGSSSSSSSTHTNLKT